MKSKQSLKDQHKSILASLWAMNNDKRGVSGGILNALIFGIGGFIIGLIVIFVIIDTITGAGLLTADGASANAVNNVTANFSAGIQNDLAPKIRTGVLVGAIVFILSILAILVLVYKRMNLGTGDIAI